MPDAGKLWLVRLLAAIAIALPGATALGQSKGPDYPTRTIKIIAPVQPGGGVDLVARTVADRLGQALGVAIVVDNQSGGGGVVGSLATARAAPDGYTLMIDTSARTALIRPCASCPTMRSRISRLSR